MRCQLGLEAKLSLAAGLWSEDSHTSHLLSPVSPQSLIHSVLRSLLVGCPQFLRAEPNQAEFDLDCG